MTGLAFVLHAALLPLALDGESALEQGSGSTTAIAVVSAVSIFAGYVLLFLLWRYVFSAKAKAKRGEPPEH
jgi:hypothetical protein